MKDVDPKEIAAGGFTCEHCGEFVTFNEHMGTQNRNHCNHCLHSKHVDGIKSGDRATVCGGLTKPVGVTLKHEGVDKYGRERLGDVMLVHMCERCGYVRINRIAADDPSEKIVEIFNESLTLPADIKETIAKANITLLAEGQKGLAEERLFGKKF